jgi:opacity protein-like surface antigen
MLGVEGGYRRQAFDVTGTDVNEVSGGELAANVITVNVVARFARGGIQPYVTGGVAFVSNDYTIDPLLAQQLAEFNFTAAESFDNTVGFNIGGGVDFQASRSIGFFVEGRYLAATADTTAGLIDDISGVEASTPGSQDINVFSIAGGIRILF